MISIDPEKTGFDMVRHIFYPVPGHVVGVVERQLKNRMLAFRYKPMDMRLLEIMPEYLPVRSFNNRLVFFRVGIIYPFDSRHLIDAENLRINHIHDDDGHEHI